MLKLAQKANEFFIVLGAIGLLVYAVLASGLVRFPEMKLLSFAFLLSAIGSFLIVSDIIMCTDQVAKEIQIVNFKITVCVFRLLVL